MFKRLLVFVKVFYHKSAHIGKQYNKSMFM